MTQSPADITSEPDQPQGDGRFRMGFMIGMAALLFLATAALLYFRSATLIEPSCVIVVDANPALKGAVVSVDSVMLAKPLEVTVGDNDRYSFPFYVDPGDYEVKVVLGGETQATQRISLDKSAAGKRVDLTRFKPTTLPVE